VAKSEGNVSGWWCETVQSHGKEVLGKEAKGLQAKSLKVPQLLKARFKFTSMHGKIAAS
jgi:hypothetical protein